MPEFEPYDKTKISNEMTARKEFHCSNKIAINKKEPQGLFLLLTCLNKLEWIDSFAFFEHFKMHMGTGRTAS